MTATSEDISHLPEEPAAQLILRAAATRRLAALRARGECTTEHVRLVASTVGAHERTVWRWLEAAPLGDRRRFTITPQLRVRLAYWRGNVHALRRELLAEADDPATVPSLTSIYRAIHRDLTLGERAGLRQGERVRRGHDVFLKRPRPHRNSVWEADHVQAPVEVVVDNRLTKPWITWFIDTGTCAIPGLAITAGHPSSESILVALRAAITTAEPHGPIGGLPSRVRVDRGKDFLSHVVRESLGAFAVRVEDLPGYTPHLKGSIEGLNNAVEKMLFAEMPRYTHRQRSANNEPVEPDQPALPFAVFVEEVLAWVRWHNHEHHPAPLDGLTPVEAWLADPTPVDEPPHQDLVHFTLKAERGQYALTTKGVRWNKRDYVAQWMQGCVGEKVKVRFMPHHTRTIEVFDTCDRYLGPAFLADEATPEQRAAVVGARVRASRRLAADLAKAEKRRDRRYGAVSVPAPAATLGSLTTAEAAAETEAAYDDVRDAPGAARPDLIPHDPIPDEWGTPPEGSS